MKKVILILSILASTVLCEDNKEKNADAYKRIYQMADEPKALKKTSEQIEEIIMSPVESEKIEKSKSEKEIIIEHLKKAKSLITTNNNNIMDKDFIISDLDEIIKTIERIK